MSRTGPRQKITYRAERRNLARDLRVVWRHLPRRRERTGNIVVDLPLESQERRRRRRLGDLPRKVYPHCLRATLLSKQVQHRKYVKENYIGSTGNSEQMNAIFEKCLERLKRCQETKEQD